MSLFNRNVDALGLNYYLDLLNGSNTSGFNPELRQTTLAQIALDIANGAVQDDAIILSHKREVATDFTEALRVSGASYGINDIETAVDLLAAVDEQADSLVTARAEVERYVEAHRLRSISSTGIYWCADDQTNFLPCPVASYPNQDGDGYADFRLTKLDMDGNELPADATDWSCVRDHVTGALWEVKTDDGGLHDRNWSSSRYAAYAGFAWGVDFGDPISFNDGKGNREYVRLVRAEPSDPDFEDLNDGTIADNSTGLIWAKCSAGRVGLHRRLVVLLTRH